MTDPTHIRDLLPKREGAVYRCQKAHAHALISAALACDNADEPDEWADGSIGRKPL